MRIDLIRYLTPLGYIHASMCADVSRESLLRTSPRAVRRSNGSAVAAFPASATVVAGWADTAVGVNRRFPVMLRDLAVVLADDVARWSLRSLLATFRRLLRGQNTKQGAHFTHFISFLPNASTW